MSDAHPVIPACDVASVAGPDTNLEEMHMNRNSQLTQQIVDRLVGFMTEFGKSRDFFCLPTAGVFWELPLEMREEIKSVLGPELFENELKRQVDQIGTEAEPRTDVIMVWMPEQSKGMALNLLRQDPTFNYMVAFLLRATLEPAKMLRIGIDEHRKIMAHLVGAGLNVPLFLNG